MTVTINNDALFPEGISYGSRGGPGYRNKMRETADRSPWTVVPNQHPLIVFDAVDRLQSQASASTMLDFIRARDGGVEGFRFRDPTDWSTHPEHNKAPSATDYQSRHVFGASDGATTDYQLVKWYRFGGIQRPRPITRPMRSGDPDRSMRVWSNGTLLTETTHYTVDTATGVLSFVVPANKGVVYEWAGTFHVPAVLGIQVDTQHLSRYYAGEIFETTVPIYEVPENVDFAEGRQRGGYSVITATGAGTQISLAHGDCIELGPTASGSKTFFLPDLTEIPAGGPIMLLINRSGFAVTIKDYAGTTVASSMTDDFFGEVYKRSDGSVMLR